MSAALPLWRAATRERLEAAVALRLAMEAAIAACHARHAAEDREEKEAADATTISGTIWIPWVSGSGTWFLNGLFRGGPDAGSFEGNITPFQGGGGG